MNTFSETQLNAKKAESMASLNEQSRLLAERIHYQKKYNLESLPDYSDHCPESYLTLLSKLANK